MLRKIPSTAMKCLHCGDDESPKGAQFCLKCGRPREAAVMEGAPGPVFPGLFDVRSWLEGKKRRNGFFGPYRRPFAICFTVMLAPKQAIAIDGSLRLVLGGIPNQADLDRQLSVRKEDFVIRRFDLLTTSFDSLSYLYRHSEPVIPVPVGGPCKLELTLTARSGEVYTASQNIFFLDREPGTGLPPPKMWTSS